MSVSAIEKDRRSVMLRGTVSDFEEAVKVKMSGYQDVNGHIFRGRSGGIKIPKELHGIVEGVFGLDDRPLARPMFQILNPEGNIIAYSVSRSYNPNDIAKIYGFLTMLQARDKLLLS